MSMCPLYYKCPLEDEVLLANETALIHEYLKIPGVLTKENLSQSYEKKYCKSDYNRCARFKLVKKVGFDYLPNNLLPHQQERVETIINRVID